MATRKRIYGRQYELACIYVPEDVAQCIMSKQKELRQGKAHDVYMELKTEYRMARNYTSSLRLQYLYEFFWVLSGETPIMLKRMDERECVPTDYLERATSAFGFDKVQPCVGVSIRVHLESEQMESVRAMMDVVERKQMRSFDTDFYMHDMKVLARVLTKEPILWVVGKSHTFMEHHNVEADAELYLRPGNEEYLVNFLRTDDTWMGSALRVAIGEEDDFYWHDGALLHKVRRDRFERIHNDYMEAVRKRLRESMAIAA